MADKVLTEAELLHDLFEAISSGDPRKEREALSAELISAEEEVDEAPVEESPGAEEETSESTEGEEVESEDKPEEQEAPAEEDWRSKLPEDIRDKVISEFDRLQNEQRRLNHYYSSNEGRVSGLQRKIDQLNAQLAALSNTPAKEDPAPVKEEVDPVIQELKENDPAMFQALEAIRKKERLEHQRELERVKAELDQQVAPLKRAAEVDFVQREVQKVKQAVPEIEEIVKMPEWSSFLNNSNDYIRAMADSPRADEFLTVVKLFAVDMLGSQPITKQAATAVPASPTATRVQESRSRRLATSTPSNRAPPVQPVEELDEAAILEREFQKLWKARGRS